MAHFFEDFGQHPGRLYVIATLLPLLSFVLLLLYGGLRSWLRKCADPEGTNAAGRLYMALGGDGQNRGGAWLATLAIFLSFCLCLYGFVLYLQAHEAEHAAPHGHATHAAESHAWDESITWVSLSNLSGLHDSSQGTVLQLGYHIDHLSGIMFVMVTFIATLIHLFSMGYMDEELQPRVEDHQVHVDHGHLVRRGRFTRFFMYLSLFCFSMLNLLLANNLFQIFVSWELVGICSYLLVGFYYERQSASNAANKAFITNRVGDAGFIIGLLILWTYIGTFNFEDLFHRLRAPERDSHGVLAYAGKIVRAEPAEISAEDAAANKAEGIQILRVQEPGEPIWLDTQAIIFPKKTAGHFHGVGPYHNQEGGEPEVLSRVSPTPRQYGSMPYWMLVLAGLGIFLGCVGKSAQFPLHVWLPDAMEGPTPVSALIHAATMVAAGVYLVGRAYPLFTPEVHLVIAYTGAITLFVAATIAVVMTDIKKVLAYSTVSQLGYMMLALGLGGWVAGLFHLVTHAFFKALLFLCSGSVIYGCHHVQDMRQMGGLYPKMRITALTMLVGTLTIAGIPLLSGWYSKDAIIAQGFGYGIVYPEHFLLTLLPLATAGLTTFYMFRMWFLTFAGEPKDPHVYEHAHETGWRMTVPLILLAIMSVCVAWGWPIWNAESSWLEHQIHHAQHVSLVADYGHVPGVDEVTDIPYIADQYSVRYQATEYHHLAGFIALGAVLIGFLFAAAMYYLHLLDPEEAAEQVPGLHGFLARKWHFDEFYSVALVRPALIVAGWCKAFDLRAIDGIIHAVAWLFLWIARIDGLIDRYIVDGLVNLIASVSQGIGQRLRRVQTGYLRSYVLFLVMAAVGIWVVMSLLIRAS